MIALLHLIARGAGGGVSFKPKPRWIKALWNLEIAMETEFGSAFHVEIRIPRKGVNHLEASGCKVKINSNHLDIAKDDVGFPVGILPKPI